MFESIFRNQKYLICLFNKYSSGRVYLILLLFFIYYYYFFITSRHSIRLILYISLIEQIFNNYMYYLIVLKFFDSFVVWVLFFTDY